MQPGSPDERLELTLGTLLRVGVLLAATVVVVGLAIYLARHGLQHAAYTRFVGEPPQLRSIPGVLARAFEVRGRGIIQLGLLLLIATPVARVAVSLVGFARERDRTYVLITTAVLAILLYSLVGR